MSLKLERGLPSQATAVCRRRKHSRHLVNEPLRDPRSNHCRTRSEHAAPRPKPLRKLHARKKSGASSPLLSAILDLLSKLEAQLTHYGPHLPSLLRQKISYTLIVWSAYGRPHRDTLTVLRSLSASIIRKRKLVSAEVVFQRLHSSITLEIWKRSARKIRACWPLAAIPATLDPDPKSLPGALGPSPSCGVLVLVAGVLPFPGPCCLEARLCGAHVSL